MCVGSLRYPAWKALHHIANCSLIGFTTLFHIISQTARFSGKKVTERRIFAMILHKTLHETILFATRIQRVIIVNINVRWSSCTVLVILVEF